MSDSDWCVTVKHFSKPNRMRGQTPTKTNIKLFVDPEEESRDNDASPDLLGTKRSPTWKTLPITSAVDLRLTTFRENKSEAFLARSQVRVSPA